MSTGARVEVMLVPATMTMNWARFDMVSPETDGVEKLRFARGRYGDVDNHADRKLHPSARQPGIAVEDLLEQPDHDLYGWILERAPTPPEFDVPLMNKLKAFRDIAHKSIGNG